MATFVPGRAVTTTVPRVTVDGGLRAGRHLFRLVVTDSAGTDSRPDEVTLVVRLLDPVIPVPVRPVPIRPGPIGPRRRGGPDQTPRSKR